MELITSVQNAKVKWLMQLKNATKDQKQFFIEGWHLCEEALLNGRLESLYINDNQLINLPSTLAKFTGPTFTINEAITDKLKGTKNSQGIFGVVNIKEVNPDTWTLDQNVLVLDDIQDPGNLGTILRSAAAFGFQKIIASPNSVNFYNEKVVRATQGLIFKLDLVTTDLEQWVIKWKNEGKPILGTNLRQPAIFLDNLTINPRGLALILGNEGHGINKSLANEITINTLISMEAGVESLNVAVAGSILMYHFRQLTKAN